MTLSVSPPALRAFGKELAQQGDHAQDGFSYTSRNAEIQWTTEGGFASLRPAHDDFVHEIYRRLLRMEELFRASQTGMGRAADYYELTDQRAADRADAAIGGLGSSAAAARELRANWLPPAHLPVPDAEDPTRFLVVPKEPDDSITNGFANPLSFLDLVSPTAWINEFIKEVSGYDLLGEVTNLFAGDWTAFYRAGDAFGNLAPFMQAVARNVATAQASLSRAWSGEAASAAEYYHLNLATMIDRHHAVLELAADHYRDAARGIWLLAQQVSSLIGLVVDRAIIAAVAAAAGTLTSESGVGALVGYGVAAWAVIDLINKLNKAALKIQTGGTLILACMGYLTGLDKQGGDLSDYPLPEQVYSHPIARNP